ncbi:hypothetical protein [Nonomuraea sp. NPDC003709]|uniref:hypothetical protein n=1 Tax=Nonomuraea sp. NPDC003709 TaxID=3154450 RepID=UPI0033A5F744
MAHVDRPRTRAARVGTYDGGDQSGTREVARLIEEPAPREVVFDGTRSPMHDVRRAVLPDPGLPRPSAWTLECR